MFITPCVSRDTFHMSGVVLSDSYIDDHWSVFSRDKLSEEKSENMDEELTKLRMLAKDLKEKVECTICMEIPRKGPVPVCPNGHFICSQCLDKRKEDGHRDCATCRVPMGNIKSLLATVVIENIDHKCDLEGCEEMVHFKEYKKHQGVCTHRKVQCPGRFCHKLLSFKEAATHTKSCTKIVSETEEVITLNLQSNNLGKTEIVVCSTFSMNYNLMLFFLKIRKFFNTYALEVVMLGSQEECEKYSVEISILDSKANPVISSRFPPRPLGLEQMGCDCLTVTEKALARVWTCSQDNRKRFQVAVNIYGKDEEVEARVKKARVQESEDDEKESEDNEEKSEDGEEESEDNEEKSEDDEEECDDNMENEEVSYGTKKVEDESCSTTDAATGHDMNAVPAANTTSTNVTMNKRKIEAGSNYSRSSSSSLPIEQEFTFRSDLLPSGSSPRVITRAQRMVERASGQGGSREAPGGSSVTSLFFSNSPFSLADEFITAPSLRERLVGGDREVCPLCGRSGFGNLEPILN